MTEPLTPSNVPAPETGPHLTCPSCGRTLRNDLPLDCPFCGASDPSRSPIPWEDPRPISFPARFFPTLRQVLFHPRSFFSRMDPLGGCKRPLLFAFLVVALPALLLILLPYLFWAVHVWITTRNYLGGIPPWPFPDIPYRVYPVIHDMALILILFPLAFLAAIFLATLLLHGCLTIVLSVQRPFRTTFRVLCYSTAPHVFSLLLIPATAALAYIPFRDIATLTSPLVLVPLLFLPGTAVALAWQYHCLVTGLAQAHQVPHRKAALAVLLIPIVAGAIGLLLLLRRLLVLR